VAQEEPVEPLAATAPALAPVVSPAQAAPPPAGERNAVRALLQAHALDWDVAVQPIYRMRGAKPVPIDGYRELVRVDIHPDGSRTLGAEAIAVVSDSYPARPNREAFQILGPLLEQDLFKPVDAGAIQGGRLVWASGTVKRATLPREETPVRGDLCLVTSHDSRGSTRPLVELTVGNRGTFRLPIPGCASIHRSRSPGSPQDAAALHRRAIALFADATHVLGAAADVRLSRTRARRFLRESFGLGADPSGWTARSCERQADILSRFAGEPCDGICLRPTAAETAPERGGSALGLFLEIVDFVDHRMRAKGGDTGRAITARFGHGDDIKRESFRLLRQVITEPGT